MKKEELQQIMKQEGNKKEVTYRGVKITLTRSMLHLNWEANFTFSSKGLSMDKNLANELGVKHSLICYIDKDDESNFVFELKARREQDLIPMELLCFGCTSNEKTYKTVEYMISACQQLIDDLTLLKKDDEQNRKEQQELRNKIASRIKDLYGLMNEINVLWDDIEDTDFLEENYPFDYSFDDITLCVGEWLDSVEEGKGL